MSRSIGFNEDLSDLRRAKACIAQTSLTNSKRRECFVSGVYPTHLQRGQGSFVYDRFRNKWIDFICGLGTNLFGYANSEINQAATDGMYNGICLSLGTNTEIEYAEKLKEKFPYIDKIKILKTGSEACTASLRIARVYTGKLNALSEGYHGWHDEFTSLTPPALGVYDNMEFMKKLSDLNQINKTIAAVIVEPIITDISRDRIEWLKKLRAKCTEVGALLIFDEVITGFRFPDYSASKYFGIKPDLTVLGKSLANGFPLAVVGGKKDIMDCGEYFVSSTYAGDMVALEAGLKVFDLLSNKYHLQELWNVAKKFWDDMNKICEGHVRFTGYPTRGVLEGPDKALFMQEMCLGGVLMGSSWFFNFPHMELTEIVLKTTESVINKIKSGQARLEGKPPQSPFAAKVRA